MRCDVDTGPVLAAPTMLPLDGRDHGPAGAAQRSATLLRQRIGDESQVAHGTRGAPACGIEKRAGVLGAVSAQSPHLGRPAILERAGAGTADDRHTDDVAIERAADGEQVARDAAHLVTVAMVLVDEGHGFVARHRDGDETTHSHSRRGGH